MYYLLRKKIITASMAVLFVLLFSQFVFSQTTFITTWKTSNPGLSGSTAITIPTKSGLVYDYAVDWNNDGTYEEGFTGNATHVYPRAGTYTVKIRGKFPTIYFKGRTDKLKILSVEQWGSNVWKTFESSFLSCGNLVINATDTPNLSSVTLMNGMFTLCTKLGTGSSTSWSSWDVSNVKNMSSMFFACANFNKDISGWNTAKVEYMQNMFNGASAFNQNIGSWKTNKVVSMSDMFYGAESFNQDIGNWVVTNVTNMYQMFKNAKAFNKDISSWDMSSVTNIKYMFSNITLSTSNYDKLLVAWSKLNLKSGLTLNAGLSTYCYAGSAAKKSLIANKGWTINDGGRATDCFVDPKDVFITTWETKNANETITIPAKWGLTYEYDIDWDGDGTFDQLGVTKNITHTYATAGTHKIGIYGVFPTIYLSTLGSDKKSKLKSIDQWGNNSWKTFQLAFLGCSNLVINATDTPNLSSVTSMGYMFAFCKQLGNGNSDSWNKWDVSNVTDMSGLFLSCSVFNKNISNWKTGKVKNMHSIFSSVTNFNQNLGEWDVSNVTNMGYMFYSAKAFDQDLGKWDVSNVTGMYNMFFGVALSTSNYDNLLEGWSKLNLQTGVKFNAGNSTFCDKAASVARKSIIDNKKWTITDAGFGNSCVPLPVVVPVVPPVIPPVDPKTVFITTWETKKANETITIPTKWGETYKYDVDWDGDGTFDQLGITRQNVTHTYATAGIHTVGIKGVFPTIYFAYSNGGSSSKIKSVEQWGNNVWKSFLYSFLGCKNLVINATDTPNLSSVTSMNYMFGFCYKLGKGSSTSWNSWDVSNVTDMSRIFFAAYNFDKNISEWKTGKAKNMEKMFFYAKVFNQDLGKWDVSNVTDMNYMFYTAKAFNQNLREWDVSNVTNMKGMFYDAKTFNQDLGKWNISNVASMDNMFFGIALSTRNYDNLLEGWSKLNLQTGVKFNAGTSTFCYTEFTARKSIIDNKKWTITDGGRAANCNIIPTFTSSPAPGGIKGELNLWLAADSATELEPWLSKLLSPKLRNLSLTKYLNLQLASTGTYWNDKSGKGNNYQSVGRYTFVNKQSGRKRTLGSPYLVQNALNYNPAVENILGGFLAPHGAELEKNWTLFFVAKKLDSGPEGSIFVGNNKGEYYWGYRGSNIHTLYLEGNPSENGKIVDNGATETRLHSYVRNDQTSSIESRYNGNSLATFQNTNSAEGIRININFGFYSIFGRDGAPGEECHSRVGEMIKYDRVLSAQEVNKVESYLSIKYGLTKKGDYIAADGTVIWHASNHPFSHINLPFLVGKQNAKFANIVGIGRDDASGLSQPKSRSASKHSALIIKGSLTNDKSFFMVGAYPAFGTVVVDRPTVLTELTGKLRKSRRFWRVQRKGEIKGIELQFSLYSMDFVNLLDRKASDYVLYYNHTNGTSFKEVKTHVLASSVNHGTGIVTFTGLDDITDGYITLAVKIDDSTGENARVATTESSSDTDTVEELQEAKFSIYPNPVSQLLTIASKNDSGFSYKVYNYVGSIVADVPFSNKSVQTVDVSTWNPGIYLVHLYLGDKLIVEKILVR